MTYQINDNVKVSVDVKMVGQVVFVIFLFAHMAVMVFAGKFSLCKGSFSWYSFLCTWLRYSNIIDRYIWFANSHLVLVLLMSAELRHHGQPNSCETLFTQTYSKLISKQLVKNVNGTSCWEIFQMWYFTFKEKTIIFGYASIPINLNFSM